MSEKMREQFETAVREKFRVCMVDFERAGDGYLNPVNDYMWWAWQASRADVVVELPSRLNAKPYACYEGGWNDMRDEAKDAIEAQGLKAAP